MGSELERRKRDGNKEQRFLWPAPSASRSESSFGAGWRRSGLRDVETDDAMVTLLAAQRFLEQNIRKCIKPRIFPMESTSVRISMEERVPTPFVFASDIRICRRALGFNFIDEILERTAMYDQISRRRIPLHTSHLISGSMPTGNETMGSPARKALQHHQHYQQQQQQKSSPDFATALKKWSAPIPPVLSRKLGRASDSPLGKVKVMLRVCDNAEEVSGAGILGVDQRRKQVTLMDPGGTNGGGPNSGPTPEERRVGVSAPKMFAFDGIFGENDDQAEVCSASAELVASVVSGEDGCFVSLGYCSSGKRQTMFGKPANQKMGMIPTAISWLFKSIQEQKQKTGSRFSIRVSAVEVAGGSGHEVINDLLLPFVNDGDQPPGAYLSDTPSSGHKNSPITLLNTVSEVRAPNPETAGFYLDAALQGMSKDDPIRHLVFTLHVYQYTIDKNGKGVVGGRSRFHCVLLGNGSPSISVLGGLLLAVLNGQRHLPSRDSKLGAILRECLGSLTCRAVVMIHVSNAHSRYAETLAALQLGSRVHRLRRSRRLKMGSVGSGNGSGGSSGGSGEEMRNGGGSLLSTQGITEGVETGSSDIDPSSSEQSCDTVIYLGPSIDEATDGEHPPVYLPSLDGDNGCEGKILSATTSKFSNGPPPKTKSPKPKSSKVSSSDGSFSNKSSEEQWVDGPKLGKYRPGSGTGTPIKKSETWIDGPAAARVHQASNFPSPKKTNQKKNNGLELGISSTKAQMIQKWISNQSHSFLDDSPPSYQEPLFGDPIQQMVAPSAAAPFFPRGTQNSVLYSSGLYSHTKEEDYMPLTVFKGETYGGEGQCQDSNGFEFELIEVIEPEVPVPTRDACLQVTEEDILLSFLEEDPLPESDQNLSPGDHFLGEQRGLRDRSCSFSEGPTYHDKNEDHPLRVLSQECLTVVSTFTDSMSIAGGDIERFWPRFGFSNDLTIQDIHEKGMCHGLCKNLVSLSQMSLTSQGGNYREIGKTPPHSPINNGYQAPEQGKTTTRVNSAGGREEKNIESIYSKIWTGKPPVPPPTIKDPPVLSDESIFKIPNTNNNGSNKPVLPINGTNSNGKCRGENPSDAETEAIYIPPMKLLDLAPIRSNSNSLEREIPGIPSKNTTTASSTINTNSPPIIKPSKETSKPPHTHLVNINQNQNQNGMLNSNGKITNVSITNIATGDELTSLLTPPASPILPNVTKNPDITKSPSKSKSRKIARFFRTRSKSPKTVGATSSSESGKSSSDAKSTASSSSSSIGVGTKIIKGKDNSSSSKNLSPKHQSPSKTKSPSKSAYSGKLIHASMSQMSDYHFTCDSVLPMFLPSPSQNQDNSMSYAKEMKMNGNNKK